MTIVVGFVGPDGAVMASDTQATEADGTSFDVDKIWVHGGILFGYSGCLSIREPLSLSIEHKLKQSNAADRWKTRALLCAAAKPVLGIAYDNFVPVKAGEDPEI